MKSVGLTRACRRSPDEGIAMELSGDANVPALPMTDAEVNHLRRLLAWIRCEYMLDESMRRGFVDGLALTVQHDMQSADEASVMLQKKADEINKIPSYVRQAVKMLTKAMSDHDRQSGIVDSSDHPRR